MSNKNNWEYKCVPCAFQKAGKDNSFSQELEAILNKFSDDGWEFYRTDIVTETIPLGCMSGGKVETRQHHIIILRKLKNA
jgi:hypothetical protein